MGFRRRLVLFLVVTLAAVQFLVDQGFKTLLNRMVGQGSRPSNGERPAPAAPLPAGPG